MSKFSASIKELKRWSNLLIKVRPNQEFEAVPDPNIPDYHSLEAWVAHPQKESKALLRPAGIEEHLLNEVPTFFIHGTSFFGGDNWNADIQERRSRELVEELVLPAQASIFNHLGAIYAPIYRQATFYSFMMSSKSAFAAIELAYQDIENAFKHFIKEIGDSPFFVAGHSQGALLGMRLLACEIEDDPELRKRLVAAYLPGYKFPLTKFDKEFNFIKKGEKPDQVHVVLAWDTYLTGFNALHHLDNCPTWLKEGDHFKWRKRLTLLPFGINPVSWDIDKPIADKSQNLGAVINEYERENFAWTEVSEESAPSIVTHSLSAPHPGLVETNLGLGNLLYISKPSGRIYNLGKMPGGNYHVYDFTFFYMDVRANASLRWAKYKSLYWDR